MKRNLFVLLFSVFLIHLNYAFSFACDEILGLCLKTSQSPTGALVTNVTGESAKRLKRAGDNTNYYLMAGKHVITSVNGNQISTRDECIAALKRSGKTITLGVYSFVLNQKRTYTVTLGNSAVEHSANFSFGESETTWKAGVRHPEIKNIISTNQSNIWKPKPGYVWNKRNDMNQGVRWRWNRRHPDYRGIYSSKTEGKWLLQPGFEWYTNRDADLRARWIGTNTNFYNNGYVPPQGPQYNPGLSPGFQQRLNNYHSPYNYRGY